MAEILGAVASGITLAALFKTCVEAFDLIQTAHNQELDLRKLVLRLGIEKCRLFTWGESLGFTTAGDDSEPTVSASCQFHEVMMETLETLLQLFNDSKKLQERYGCKQYLESPFAHDEQTGQVRILAASFNNFKTRSSLRGKRTKILNAARWAIHDRKKFASFISDIKELIDGLQDITKPLASISRQENSIKRRIESINDAETLNMVSEVCYDDHPTLSQIASDRADTISSATMTARWKIENWHLSPTAIEYGEVDSLETLDITELKHQVLRLMMERQDLKTRLNDLQGRFSDFPVVSTSTAVLTSPRGHVLSFNFEEETEYVSQNESAINDKWEDESALKVVGKAISDDREEGPSNVTDVSNSVDIPQNSSKVNPDVISDPGELMVARLKEETAGFTRSPSSYWSDQMVSALLIERKPIFEIPTPLEVPPKKNENADDQYGLTNGFLDFARLTDDSHGTEIGRQDYFVLSFEMPRRQTPESLLESLSHKHYVKAMHVGRLTLSRDAPRIPSQWPRNLQIVDLVAEASVDGALRQTLQRGQSHVYMFGVTSFSTICSNKRGCLHNLFDALADAGEYARCVPEMVDIGYPTPTVYVLPFGPSHAVPEFLHLFRPGLVPQSKTLLILLIYSSDDFSDMNLKVARPITGNSHLERWRSAGDLFFLSFSRR